MPRCCLCPLQQGSFKAPKKYRRSTVLLYGMDTGQVETRLKLVQEIPQFGCLIQNATLSFMSFLETEQPTHLAAAAAADALLGFRRSAWLASLG